MEILNVVQGSPEWDAARAHSFNASEAAAMMGLNPKVKRNELLRMKKTCSDREFSVWVRENLLERGHEVEAKARAFAETHIGEELYPTTGWTDVDGLKCQASFDGITMGGSTIWENKLWNAELSAAIDAGEVPEAWWPQLEHQLLVSDAEKIWFTISDGTAERTKGLWYESIPERQSQLINAWTQFETDLRDYKAVEIIPAAIGTPVKTLPAITYRLNGLALTSNLSEFKVAAEQLVEDSKAPLQTDQDFSDRETLVKSFKETEDKIALVQSQVVGEIKDVDAFCRNLGDIAALIRVARLNGEKQIQARKDAIRLDILAKGQAAFAAHVLALNTRLGKPYMPAIAVDFGGAMKGKRTIASLQNAVDTELSRAKIAANEIGDRIQVNLNTLRDLAKDYAFLFSDTAQIVLKAPDDLTALAKLRIADHKAEESRKLEAERERIRKEEADKLAKAQEERDRLAREEEQRERDRQVREAATTPVPAAVAPTPAIAPAPNPAPIPSTVPGSAAVGDTVQIGSTSPLFTQVAAVAVPQGTATLRTAIDAELAEMTDRELIDVLDAINSIRIAFGRGPARRVA